MPWIRIEIGTPGRCAEAVGAKLSALGAAAVTYLDDGDSPILEPAPWAVSDPDAWSAVRVAGLFELDADLRAVRSAFSGRPVDVEFLSDDDWVNAWRRFARVRRFDRLTIVPSAPDGTDVAADDAPVPAPGGGRAAPAEVVMRLDPGLAFGTGSHPTTRLCLEWLAEWLAGWLAERLPSRDIGPCSVLDYGCGSGVLSIAAKLLGAGRVVGVDHDPQALTAARANATRNGVGIVLEHSDAFSWESGRDAEDATAPFDIVMANIVSGTLVELAPRLSGCVAAEGSLVLCGVLSDQVDEVVRAYPDFAFRTPKRLEEWVLLHGEHI